MWTLPQRLVAARPRGMGAVAPWSLCGDVNKLHPRTSRASVRRCSPTVHIGKTLFPSPLRVLPLRLPPPLLLRPVTLGARLAPKPSAPLSSPPLLSSAGVADTCRRHPDQFACARATQRSSSRPATPWRSSSGSGPCTAARSASHVCGWLVVALVMSAAEARRLLRP